MPLHLAIPGREAVELEILVLDVNGTLTSRGVLIEGVIPRLQTLRDVFEIRLLSADTLGALDSVTRELAVEGQRAVDAQDKQRAVEALGAERCVAIGNGANDALMLGCAALGIAVVGPEGASSAAVAAADIICGSIVEALDLLRDPLLITATLRP